MEPVHLNQAFSITTTTGAYPGRDTENNQLLVQKQNLAQLTTASAANEANPKKKLSESDQKRVREMKDRDREVRDHEQAHKQKAGQYAKGAASFDYEQGPDGQAYVVSGEVQLDMSEVPGDPEATIRKMQQIRAAALAPESPSEQDRKVASEASRIEMEMLSKIAGEARKKNEQPSDPAQKAYNNAPQAELPANTVDMML